MDFPTIFYWKIWTLRTQKKKRSFSTCYKYKSCFWRFWRYFVVPRFNLTMHWPILAMYIFRCFDSGERKISLIDDWLEASGFVKRYRRWGIGVWWLIGKNTKANYLVQCCLRMISWGFGKVQITCWLSDIRALCIANLLATEKSSDSIIFYLYHLTFVIWCGGGALSSDLSFLFSDSYDMLLATLMCWYITTYKSCHFISRKRNNLIYR